MDYSHMYGYLGEVNKTNKYLYNTNKTNSGWLLHADDVCQCPYCKKYQRVIYDMNDIIMSVYCQFCGKKVKNNGERI